MGLLLKIRMYSGSVGFSHHRVISKSVVIIELWTVTVLVYMLLSSFIGFPCVSDAPKIFLKMFFKKHKLYNLIKREIHMLIVTTIKKTRKYT